MTPDLALLESAAKQLGIALPADSAAQLIAFRDLIAKWNKVYNLTSLRDPALMLSHHIIDSLAVALPLQKHLQKLGLDDGRLLDVGSGGGLPGVVLATVMPKLDVTCVDAVGKKAAFVQQVANALGIKSLRGVHARVEQMHVAAVDVISSRAFASLADFVQLTQIHLKPTGVWMALKGKRPDDEMTALPASVEVFHVEHLTVPGVDAERCIIWMRPRP